MLGLRASTYKFGGHDSACSTAPQVSMISLQESFPVSLCRDTQTLWQPYCQLGVAVAGRGTLTMEATSNDSLAQPHRGAWEPSKAARHWTHVPITQVCCDCPCPSVLNGREAEGLKAGFHLPELSGNWLCPLTSSSCFQGDFPQPQASVLQGSEAEHGLKIKGSLCSTATLCFPPLFQ